MVRPFAQRLAPPVGRLRDAELLVHLLAPAPRHVGAATRLLLEHFQLREQLRPGRLLRLPVEADAVQQRDAALCSFAGAFLLGRGALRRGLLEGLSKGSLLVHPCAQRLAPPVGRLRGAELLVHPLAPALWHGGAATRLLLEHFQLREQVHPARLVLEAANPAASKRAKARPLARPRVLGSVKQPRHVLLVASQRQALEVRREPAARVVRRRSTACRIRMISLSVAFISGAKGWG